MGVAELTLERTPSWALSLGRRAWIPAAILVFAFLAYYISASYLISPTDITRRPPPERYQHHLYLADAILHGTLDVNKVGFPSSEHDTITEGNAKYVPFPPGPSFLMLPFVAVFGTDFVKDITGIGPLHGLGEDPTQSYGAQIYFSFFIGAINVVLFWYLLGILKISNWTKALLVPFFAFGTVHFFTTTTGTAWHYAHTSAVLFLSLAIISMLRRAPPFVPAIFLGLAFLSREPTALAAPFFAYWYYRQNHDSLMDLIRKRAFLDKKVLVPVGLFAAGMLPFVLFWFWYNDTRFGGPLSTGYDVLYEHLYKPQNLYSFYRRTVPPETAHFGQFDPRNIPLHLYTLFIFPPDFRPDWDVFRPNAYGLSVLLTSPAFVYAAFVRRKDALVPACWIAVALICIPLFLHYSQGWVQFGYRFLLDFAPFLLILTAFGFDDHASPSARRLQVALVAISVLAGFWGRYWANYLGW
jgi:hypothetical protein